MAQEHMVLEIVFSTGDDDKLVPTEVAAKVLIATVKLLEEIEGLLTGTPSKVKLVLTGVVTVDTTPGAGGKVRA